jgi:hypothetical protein
MLLGMPSPDLGGDDLLTSSEVGDIINRSGRTVVR